MHCCNQTAIRAGAWLTFASPIVQTPIYALLDAPEVKRNQWLLECTYKIDGQNFGQEFFFWYEHAPTSIDQMIAADAKGVLRDIGTAAATTCPQSQQQADKLRRGVTGAYRKK